MRLVFLILCMCLITSPAWALEPPVPSPKAKRQVKRGAPINRPAPKPAPTEKVQTPADDERPPPSTPSDVEPTPEPSLPRFDSSWRTCREDKDCIAIDTRCGWGCINGTFEKPASQYYRQLAPFIECASTALDDKPNAICVKKECVCQK